jgi:hypothetical protein
MLFSSFLFNFVLEYACAIRNAQENRGGLKLSGIHQRAVYAETKTKKLNSVAVVRKRVIPIERPSLFGEVSANLCG